MCYYQDSIPGPGSGRASWGFTPPLSKGWTALPCSPLLNRATGPPRTQTAPSLLDSAVFDYEERILAQAFFHFIYIDGFSVKGYSYFVPPFVRRRGCSRGKNSHEEGALCVPNWTGPLRTCVAKNRSCGTATPTPFVLSLSPKNQLVANPRPGLEG